MGHANLREESGGVLPLDLFASGKHLVYTVISEGYDSLKVPLWRPENVEYVAFVTGSSNLAVTGWKISQLEDNLGNPKLLNRRMKILGIDFEERYDSVVYVDGSIQIIGSLEHVISCFLESGEAIGLFRHFDRTNPWDEIIACTQLGYLSDAEKRFEEARLQPLRDQEINLSLFDAGVILKNPKKGALTEITGRWYELFMQNPVRDQLSLPIVVSEKEQEVLQFEHWRKRKSPIFLRHPHKGSHPLIKLIFFLGSWFPSAFHNVLASIRHARQWLPKEVGSR